MKNHFFLFFLLSMSNAVLAQKEKIKGRILFEDSGIAQITILNRTDKTSTKTDTNGFFIIHAKPNDEIVVLDDNRYFDTVFVVLSEKDFKKEDGVMQIQVFEKAVRLDEMVIDQTISSKSLGFDNFKYTAPNPTNMDFMAIGRGLAKLFGGGSSSKPKKVKERYISSDEQKNAILYEVKESHFINYYHVREEDLPKLLNYLIIDSNFMNVVYQGHNGLIELELIQKIQEFNEMMEANRSSAQPVIIEKPLQ